MRKKRGRDINGILLLDKPSGMTSNDSLQMVKRLYFAAKAGHTGSLDPLATGMLPICFGEATKFAQYLLNANKTYRVTARLGVTTTTGDTEGEVVKTTPVADISAQTLEKALARFRGPQTQIPSMYSALKYQGKPLYQWAREGVTIEREPRAITIHQLHCLKMHDQELTLDVACTKGTYIRTLIEDLGEVLGCGAHVTVLHRQTVDPFASDEMVSLPTIQTLRDEQAFAEMDALLLPISAMVPPNWVKLNLTKTMLLCMKRGQAVWINQAPECGHVALYHTDEFVGIGEVIEDGRVEPRRIQKQPCTSNKSPVAA